MAGKREQEIIESYEEWSPDEETVTELVERLGISRQRLYDVLGKHSVIPKSRRPVNPSDNGDGLLAEMAEMALGYLLRQLQEARAEIAEYRERYGPI